MATPKIYDVYSGGIAYGTIDEIGSALEIIEANALHVNFELNSTIRALSRVMKHGTTALSKTHAKKEMLEHSMDDTKKSIVMSQKAAVSTSSILADNDNGTANTLVKTIATQKFTEMLLMFTERHVRVVIKKTLDTLKFLEVNHAHLENYEATKPHMSSIITETTQIEAELINYRNPEHPEKIKALDAVKKSLDALLEKFSSIKLK